MMNVDSYTLDFLYDIWLGDSDYCPVCGYCVDENVKVEFIKNEIYWYLEFYQIVNGDMAYWLNCYENLPIYKEIIDKYDLNYVLDLMFESYIERIENENNEYLN